jgi:Ca-activated chloride channel family protein
MELLPISIDNSVNIGDVSAGEPIVLVFTIIVESSMEEMGYRRIMRMDIQAEKPDTGNAFSLARDIHILFTEEPEEKPISSRIFNILSRLSVYQLQEKAWNALDADDIATARNYLESAATKLFELGYPELAQATQVEIHRISVGDRVSDKGRKQIRYGTRSLTMP